MTDLKPLKTTSTVSMNDNYENDELANDNMVQDDLHHFPDGGPRAWMTVVGGFLSAVAGIGVLSGFAVFQSFYSTVGLAGYSPAEIAWIGNLQIWGCFAFGLFSGWLSDKFGPQLPMALGSFFIVFGTMMASVSTKYYHFILSQGVCSALGIGLTFVASLSVQCQWFFKKRGLVVGLVLSGQNVGGVIWPVVVNNMVNIRGISFGWTLRTIGFIQLVLMALATVLMHRRYPRGSEKHTIPVVDFLKHKATMVFTLAMFIGFLGIYIPYFYITSYGVQYGVDPTLAFYYSAILNAAAFFGCHIAGYVADSYVGAFNMLTGLTLASGIAAFGWMGARTNAGMIVWIIVYGLLTGGLQAIFTPCVAALAPSPEIISTWNGMVLAIVSFAVLGTGSIGGQLLVISGDADYHPMQAFTGTSLTVAGVFFLVIRRFML